MKRHGNLFAKIVNIENIREAHRLAQRGKRHYTAVRKINKDPEPALLALQELLTSGKFMTSSYQTEERFEGGKWRTIHKLPYYPDRIVQHAIMNICAPIWRRSFIRNTFQSIEGRGCHDARKRINKYLASGSKHHAIKMDVQKFYPSVPNAGMKLCIRKTIKCRETLKLLDNIIDSHQGLPIGNYTSQYFGNLYLSEIDWWATQESGVGAFFRYCDDIVLIDSNPAKVHEVSTELIHRITCLGLTIKPSVEYRHVEGQGLDFCGFVFYGSKTRLRGRIRDSLERCAKGTSKSGVLKGLISYWGWVKQIDAKQLWRKTLTPKLLAFTDGVFRLNPLRRTL